MEMTGPEHAAHAEALLTGQAKWPSRISDRMAAAQAHATLAFVSLMAHAVTDELGAGDQHSVDARNYDWRAALPLPYVYDYAAPADVDSNPVKELRSQ